MTAEDMLNELASLGSEQTKKILIRHGAKEPFFGVKIEHLKKIQKKIKRNHELALELYETGNSDAMYLAGLIADETKMTKENLRDWADKAYWYMLSEYTVPWIASESRYGRELAMEWIESDRENIASAGWSTLSNLVSIIPDEELNISELKKLLERVKKQIHEAPNRVRYAMNGFVIAVGSYIGELSDISIETAEKIGKVNVDMGGTACKVPYAPEYIIKIKQKGTAGKKRKTARC